MAYTLPCPSCGKPLTFQDEQAGTVTLCPACGMAIQVPGGKLSLRSDEQSAREADQTDVPPPSPKVDPPEEFDGEVLPQRDWAGGSRISLWTVGIVMALLVAVQAIVVVWWLVAPGKTWEAAHRDELLTLTDTAKTQRSAGQYAEAFATLRSIDKLLLGNAVRDPALLDALRGAEDAEDALGKQLQAPVSVVAAPEVAPATQQVAMVPTTPPEVAIARTTAPTSLPTTAPEILPTRTVAEKPPGPLNRPLVKEMPPAPPVLGPDGQPLATDEQIGRTIERGVATLTGQFNDGVFPGSDGYPSDGVNALVVYALLQAGQATHDAKLDPHGPFMKQVLDKLGQMPLDNRYGVYTRALRANALALAARPEDKTALEADARWLLQAQRQGGYTYNDKVDNAFFHWDNSNSQYGVLGVWAAADAGVSVSTDYWAIVQQHWNTTQLPNGAWSYTQGGDERVSMTLAGLATLFVTQDYLDANGTSGAVGREPFSPALSKGLNWFLNNGYKGVAFNEGWPGYTLYGLERVGLASGFKFFGSNNWYPEFASQVVRLARPDGSWGSPISTAYALLFLARGRHPLIMNKLQFDGAWDNRPRDLSNLARYVGRTLETQLNWQVVPLDHDWRDWTDSSVLYLASHVAPKLGPDDEAKLKAFVLSGGLLLTQADGDSAAFDGWAKGLGERLFPEYKWEALPPDHPLFSTVIRVKGKVDVQAISNGARLLMVELPHDISHFWQNRAQSEHADAFGLGMNIFAYASGKSDLRNRLASSIIATPNAAPAALMQVAAVRIGNEPDHEPEAWPRFTNWFETHTSLGIKLVPTQLADLAASGAPLAQMDGIDAFSPTDGQVTAVKTYVENGGVLLIDPCGGPNEFLKSVRQMLLPRAFPLTEAAPIPSGHPLLNSIADGMLQLNKLDVRDYVRSVTPPLDREVYMLRFGKGAVIVSTLDLTSGLLGTRTWPVAGFSAETSEDFVNNVVLWTWDGGKE